MDLHYFSLNRRDLHLQMLILRCKEFLAGQVCCLKLGHPRGHFHLFWCLSRYSNTDTILATNNCEK